MPVNINFYLGCHYWRQRTRYAEYDLCAEWLLFMWS